MSRIFVEEENTVYELDEECLKRKERMQQQKKTSKHLMKLSIEENKKWIIAVVLLCTK